MENFDKIIDYVIEQANRYDIKNMQFEQDILFLINQEQSALFSKILNNLDGIDNAIEMQLLLTRIEAYYATYTNKIMKILDHKFEEYYDIAGTRTDDLIQLGKEVEGRLSENVKEFKNVYSEESINFIRDHAFELLKGHSNRQVERLRSELGNMLLNRSSGKAEVRALVEKVLEVNKSKAEEIAQTELSRAYNYGVMNKMEQYASENPGQRLKKYWHGFKFSNVTCTYCRPRIGNIYDLYDNTEHLPAHVRCRCVWLPMFDGWDTPVSTGLIRKANMLNTVYSSDQLYSRINTRLDINYGKYIDKNMIAKYLEGDRSQIVLSAIESARGTAISHTKDSFEILADNTKARMSNEFNIQMGFWKTLIAGAIVDNDKDLLERSKEAIKGVMVLPWNIEQLSKWNILLNKIDSHI